MNTSAKRIQQDIEELAKFNKRATEGWRYVGFIPAIQRGTGHIEEMDLVFEREQQVGKQ